MTQPLTRRDRTAMSRLSLSRPMRLALDDAIVTNETSVFDYGCGKGGDVHRLREQGVTINGWDPVFRPRVRRHTADVVNLGYVVNVIEDPEERSEALSAAWSLAERVLVVAGRLTDELQPENLTPFADGWMTSRDTFQKFYEQVELRQWIDVSLGVECVASGPGVFYVFREDSDKQAYLARRTRRRRVAIPRRRIADELFDTHRDLLEPLMQFVADRGRLPRDDELAEHRQIAKALGSTKRAYRVVLWATDQDEWARIRSRRSDDLALYLGLARFDGRPRFSQLPRDVQFDVKAFFGTYTRACEEADRLLYSAGDLDAVTAAARESSIGKLLPEALYVHRSAIGDLPLVLRAYEGCASTFIGSIDDANIVKLRLDEPKVSYLHYPDFDTVAHPVLRSSVVVPLQTFWVKYRDFSDQSNPPILHRKELLVSEDYPGREKFARLTRREEQLRLLEMPSFIGTRRGWETALHAASVEIRGHRVYRIQGSSQS